jgi:3-hydroxyisobutyrate dehydrogenase-like beta-hydroxyacid dehydrogenase
MGYAMADGWRGGATGYGTARRKASRSRARRESPAPPAGRLRPCSLVSTWDDARRSSRPRRAASTAAPENATNARRSRSTWPTRELSWAEINTSPPVSGNAKVIKAGRLSFVCSGPREAYDAALPSLKAIARAASYVGDGELARIVKICHNVFLGVVIQSLAEITVLAQKAGVPRHAFLEFMNQSVMGSTFSRYKTPAFVNLDFKVTFTPYLLRKDLDLGLDAGRRFEVPMPLASVTRDILQTMIGRGMTKEDFAQLLVLQAEASGLKLEPENVPVSDGL